jgi:thiopurine S-methyltransferase
MHEDWIARWREGRIAFHEDRPNALLERHRARLAGCRRVFVPLCGRAEDLAFLAAHGHDVVGVELAEQAVREFFEQHALTPAVIPPAGRSDGQDSALVEYRAGSITLFAGDFFATTPEVLGLVDGLYDRAALVALPAELRPRYVAHLRTLLPPGAPGLVNTFEYDQQRVNGPPFAVLETELRALWAGATVEFLDQQPGKVTRCAEANIPVVERCYAIRLGQDARRAPGTV